jgi:PadR family transcriptional regulator, regulatory protein AphA
MSQAVAKRARAREQPLTNAAGAVLGMVALGASSGYRVKRTADRSLRFFWALGPPQIYSELQRLDALGFVKGADAARGERRRRRYAITAAGRRALRRWLTEARPASLEIRDPLLLRLFFADALTPEATTSLVEMIGARSLEAVRVFEQEILPLAERTADHGFSYPREVARFGVELHEFLAGWSERLAAALAEADA